MIRVPRLAAAWSKVRMYLVMLDEAFDYDPLEGHQRWIADLDRRVARLEAGSSGSAELPGHSLPET